LSFMLDRIQTIDRLLDIASKYYQEDGVVTDLIGLIEDLSLPNFSTDIISKYPDPPKDAFVVKKEFAISSTSLKRYKLMDRIDDMFKVVKSQIA